MADRYYNTADGTELIEGVHDIEIPTAIKLPDDNVFWSQIPEGMLIEYDEDNIPLGYIPIPPPTPEQVESDLRSTVLQDQNDTAIEYSFLDIGDAVSYANEPAYPDNQSLGLAFRQWRSESWKTFDEIMEEVGNGTIPPPGIDDIVGLLPPFIPPT